MDNDDKLLEFKRDQIRRETGLTNEEFAADVLPWKDVSENNTARMGNNRIIDVTAVPNKAIGWIALFVALVSLIVWPVILGPAAAIMGVFAYTRGIRLLGVGSIIIGLISLIAYIVLVPFYT